MKRFTNILFVAESGVDNTPALNRALTLAENNQASLLVAGTLDLRGSARKGELRSALIAQREDELQTLLSSAATTKVRIETKILVGKPFIEIIREVNRQGRDLVIKSSGVESHRSPGGTDIRLLRKCPCPVWIINSADQRGYREVLVALDWEPENPENEPLNRQLMEMATSLALSDFAELHVVHAWRLEHESFLRSPRSGLSSEEVDEMVQEKRAEHETWLSRFVKESTGTIGDEASRYLNPQIHLIHGDASNAVSDCAHDLGAELVVMGTVGRTGVPGFVIGNTAEKILSRIDCSILAIKPAGFVSPVTIEDSRRTSANIAP